MKLPDILSMSWEELRGMGRRELSKIVSSMASAANKRIKRFEQAGENSPATRYAEKAGRFSVAGKNLNQLRAEYTRAKSFLNQETSTLRQWKQTKKETVNTLRSMGVNIPEEDVSDVMKVYGKLKQEFPDIAESNIYAPAIQEIYDRLNAGDDPDAIIEAAKKQMMQGYEQRERENYDYITGGVSDFF